jgi:TPR repeat protein
VRYTGKGGPVDHAAAATWWKRAADKGHADAIQDLPIALTRLFPPGTHIELDGVRGVMDAAPPPDGKIVFALKLERLQ